MIVAKVLENEAERLEALVSYHILDTLPEEEFDALTQMAATICKVPISLISLVDDHRQWFKSKTGLNTAETPRDVAFCTHAIQSPNDVLIVEDSRTDERFHDNPLVLHSPHVLFYAGIPLVTPSGHPVGTLCVIDNKPNSLSKEQVQALRTLGRQVMQLMELKKKNRELEESQSLLAARNAELQEFGYILTHDIRSPVKKINALLGVMREEYDHTHLKPDEQILKFLEKTGTELEDLVDGVIRYFQNENEKYLISEFYPTKLVGRIQTLLHIPKNFKISSKGPDQKPYKGYAFGLEQILLNLIQNSIKYNDKEKGWVKITYERRERLLTLKVEDNGRGIPQEVQDKVFIPFFHLPTKDRFQTEGTGIGLATVARIVEKVGGNLQLESKVGVGTTFTINYPIID